MHPILIKTKLEFLVGIKETENILNVVDYLESNGFKKTDYKEFEFFKQDGNIYIDYYFELGWSIFKDNKKIGDGFLKSSIDEISKFL